MKPDSEFTEEARTIVQGLDSYKGALSSGTGLHIMAEGDQSDDHKHRGDLLETGRLEVYDESRYFVLTGNVYKGFTSVESRPAVVRDVKDDYCPVYPSYAFTDHKKLVSEQDPYRKKTDATTEQVRRIIEEYGNCKQTEVDHTRVLHRWKGQDGMKTSASELDMTFIEQLYFWC